MSKNYFVYQLIEDYGESHYPYPTLEGAINHVKKRFDSAASAWKNHVRIDAGYSENGEVKIDEISIRDYIEEIAVPPEKLAEIEMAANVTFAQESAAAEAWKQRYAGATVTGCGFGPRTRDQIRDELRARESFRWKI